MSKIHKLSDLVVSKTAAGQIIESPYDVVKELIENSLDAGAKNIVVELKGNGFEKIKIVDDGFGMSKEDLLLSVAPYATSKITKFEDIDELNSFGFRGEALHALSVVSKLRIISRELNDKIGNFIEIVEGHIINSGSIAASIGTTVETSELFYNFPARKKSFKDTRTIFLKIVDLIGHFSLIHHEICFSLYSDSRLIFKTNSKMSFETKFKKVSGVELNENFIPISLKDNEIKLFGYIAKPQKVDEIKTFQISTVNDRLIKSSEISDCIKKSYSSLIPHKITPSYFIKISLRADLIDPNVDPKKDRVSFREISKLQELLSISVSKIFQEISLAYNYKFQIKEKADSALFGSLKDSEVSTSLKTAKPFISEIFQVGRLYIIRTTKDGLDIFDQHAVHERVLYEAFLKAFNSSKEFTNSFKLNKPVIIEVSVRELETFNLIKDILIKSGFDIDIFGKFSLKINEVPLFLKTFNITKVIKDFLSETNLKSGLNNEKLINSTISYLACRSAIKSGDELDKDEIENLIHKIDSLSNLTSYTCPHGRPIRAHISLSELGKVFKR